MSDFDDWLTSNGKCRETASDLDEIQWLRLERQRLRSCLRWIPVNERLPRFWERVIFFQRGKYSGFMGIGDYQRNENGKPMAEAGLYSGACHFTHWMPLPEPPTQCP
jgi:hypothetical protein